MVHHPRLSGQAAEKLSSVNAEIAFYSPGSTSKIGIQRGVAKFIEKQAERRDEAKNAQHQSELGLDRCEPSV